MPIDHLGIAVARLSDALAIWEPILGTKAGPAERVEGQRVRVAFLPAGNAELEFLEATESDSPVGRFLAERGPGLHHVAFRVPHLDATLRTLEGQGYRLIDRVGRPGARGHRVGFVHPKATGGVLLEFVEAP